MVIFEHVFSMEIRKILSQVISVCISVILSSRKNSSTCMAVIKVWCQCIINCIYRAICIVLCTTRKKSYFPFPLFLDLLDRIKKNCNFWLKKKKAKTKKHSVRFGEKARCRPCQLELLFLATRPSICESVDWIRIFLVTPRSGITNTGY